MLAHAMEYSIRMMCRVLNVSTGGYYAWKKRKPSAQQQRREQFTDAVETFHEDSKGAYGYRKIHEDIIEGFDVPCCLETVRRIMKDKGLRSTRGRKFVVTTDSNHTMPVAENILDRNFESDASNEKWVTDITFIPTHRGWTYLATVMDLFARRIVGWRVSNSMKTEFVLDALEQALYARQPSHTDSLIHHSDRGSQYVSIRYTERLAEAGIEPSVGSKGDSYDNALAETINGLYKAELIYRQSWRSREAVEIATLKWVHWYNQ